MKDPHQPQCERLGVHDQPRHHGRRHVSILLVYLLNLFSYSLKRMCPFVAE